MPNSLQKYVAPNITPAIGGLAATETLSGFPGANPQYLGGFYPTAPYAALRTFVDGDGVTQLYPLSFVNYRLNPGLLLASPPVSLPEATQLIENELRGQFDASRPYVYLKAMFNVPLPAGTAPYPVPEVFDRVLPNTWGAGAETTDVFANRGRFTFTADAGAYAVVGLVAPGGDLGDPASVAFGFLLRSVQGCSSVMESGTVVALGATYAFSAATSFAVQYVDGAVSYLIDGVVRRTVTVPVLESDTVFRGGASLYSGNSNIVGLSVVGYSRSAGALPALTMPRKAGIYSLPALRAGGGWRPYAAATLPAMRAVGGRAPYAYAAARLPALQLTSRSEYAQISLRPLTMTGGRRSAGVARLPRAAVAGSDRAYGGAAVQFRPLTGRANTGRAIPLGGMGVLPRLRAIAVGTSGQMGQGAARLPALRGRAGRAISGATVALRKPLVLGYQDPAREAFISGAPFASDPGEVSLIVLVSMDSSGNITDVRTVQYVVDARIDGAATLDSTATTTLLIQALMDSALIGGSFVPMSEQGGETWVLNVDTNASSTYESYAFNSYGTVGGRTYGARADGLYLLEGETDNGLPIRASMSFGSTNFGTDYLKRLEYAYLGLASSGKMYLKVILGDGTSYVYEARNSADHMAVQRIEVGRGLRASFMTFELYNSDGCDFDLSTADFQAVDLSRKI